MWLSGMRIVLPSGILPDGSLRIEDGRISELIEGDASSRDGVPVLDMSGLTAIPGMIDVHGDMLEREIQPRPGAFFPFEIAIFELDKRLAATGVTTAYAGIGFYGSDSVMTCAPPTALPKSREQVSAFRSSLLVDFRVHTRFEITNPDFMPIVTELLSAGHVHLISFMDHTPGQGQFRDLEVYVEFTQKLRNIDRVDAEEATRLRIEKGMSAPPFWHAGNELIRIAREKGLPIASHDDDTVARVNLIADLGVTICEFPVTMEAAQEAKRRGLHVVVGSPNALRGNSLTGNISAMKAIEAVVGYLSFRLLSSRTAL